MKFFLLALVLFVAAVVAGEAGITQFGLIYACLGVGLLGAIVWFRDRFLALIPLAALAGVAAIDLGYKEAFWPIALATACIALAYGLSGRLFRD